MCLGAALARLELQVLFGETLACFPKMEPGGAATMVESPFINQVKTLPVSPSSLLGSGLINTQSIV